MVPHQANQYKPIIKIILISEKLSLKNRVFVMICFLLLEMYDSIAAD